MRKLVLAAAFILPAALAQAETDNSRFSTLTASTPQTASSGERAAARAERVSTEAARPQNGAP